MNFILIAMFAMQGAPVFSTMTATFASREACEAAKTVVLTNAQTLNSRMVVLQQCVVAK